MDTSVKKVGVNYVIKNHATNENILIPIALMDEVLPCLRVEHNTDKALQLKSKLKKRFLATLEVSESAELAGQCLKALDLLQSGVIEASYRGE